MGNLHRIKKETIQIEELDLNILCSIMIAGERVDNCTYLVGFLEPNNNLKSKYEFESIYIDDIKSIGEALKKYDEIKQLILHKSYTISKNAIITLNLAKIHSKEAPIGEQKYKKIYLCYVGLEDDRECIAVFDQRLLAERFLLFDIILNGVFEKLAHYKNSYMSLEHHYFPEFEIHYAIKDRHHTNLQMAKSVKIEDLIHYLDIEEIELNKANFK